jgi:D-glycero-alpha-D-manno-heptose-7-phosphate kinase
MIITRSPLRISLGGGGTDLPSYYEQHTGFLIAAAIDKYVYINLNSIFTEDFLIRYSKTEKVKAVSEIQHPIVREALKLVGVTQGAIEIDSMADIPAGTGLGSSGSFTTALLKALHTYKRNSIQARELAEQACHIEMDLLKEPIGKQDQYIAATGGINCFEFLPNGQVNITPLQIKQETMHQFEDHLMLFFTGYSRKAGEVLSEQDKKSKEKDKDMISNLHYVKEIGLESKKVLERGDLPEFARLMDQHWQHKKKRSQSMSNDHINRWYDMAMQNGAMGGKLIGAGGGGFLMFYTEDPRRLRQLMAQEGLKEVRFKFDLVGTTTLVQS